MINDKELTSEEINTLADSWGLYFLLILLIKIEPCCCDMEALAPTNILKFDTFLREIIDLANEEEEAEEDVAENEEWPPT